MDEETQDEPLINHRSRAFTTIEMKKLIECVEKYKEVILNKSNNTIACRAKDVTWKKIADVYNSYGLYERSIDSLKMKWDNLKRTARKVSNNLLEASNNEHLNEVTRKVMELIYEAKQSSYDTTSGNKEISNAIEETNAMFETEEIKAWNNDEGTSEIDEDDEKVLDAGLDHSTSQENRNSRSINFSPKECSLLLQCVKSEKKHIFCKDTTSKANHMKNRAWERITDSYNGKSQHKRSLKVLQTKFNNMKKLSKRFGLKRELNLYIGSDRSSSVEKKIKLEPLSDLEMNMDVPIGMNPDEDNISDVDSNCIPDPLSTVLNDCNGKFNSCDSFMQSDRKEIVRLKIELLKHQIETAKMERQRARYALRTARAEGALRVRTARLRAAAAEAALAPHTLRNAETTNNIS